MSDVRQASPLFQLGGQLVSTTVTLVAATLQQQQQQQKGNIPLWFNCMVEMKNGCRVT